MLKERQFNKKSQIIMLLAEMKIYDSIKIKDTEVKADDDLYYSKTDEVDGNKITKYYRIETRGLSSEEIQIALLAKQTNTLNTIKGILIFFVVLAILSIIATFFCCYQLFEFVHHMTKLFR